MQINLTGFLPYARNAMKKANAIIVTTEETLKCFPEKYQDKITVMLSLGIDEEFMRGKIEGKSQNKIRILMVGRMIGWKGFDIGISAFKSLLYKYDNIELHLRGNGNLKASLKQSCGNLLNTKIFFCEDFLDYKDMYGFYTKYDIFLNCTLHDSGCLALLEAMSAGLPVVCIDVGGPRVLTDSKHALKIQTNEYKRMICSVSEALEKLICNKSLREGMGEKSKEKVLNQFMYQNKFNQIEKIYCNIKNN
jgi:glycosyltransferase involved in cell wall biosynthesis